MAKYGYAVKPIEHENNKDRAGQTWVDKGETVRYNDLGQVVAVAHKGSLHSNDGVIHRPTPSHANDSDAHRKINDLAKAGKWDEATIAANRYLGDTSHATDYTAGDFTAAREYMRELKDAYGYNANDYYRGKYDAIYGEGAWDRPEPSHTPVNGAANGMIGGSVSGSISGIGGPGGTPAPGSAEAYLRDLYQRKADAEEARLKAAYDSNVSAIDGELDRLDDAYEARRREAEGENDLQRMRMNELLTAQGLNTGATGQMALGQSQAYQNALGQLAAQYAQDQANAERRKSDLKSTFNSAINEARANGDAQLADALYKDYIRRLNEANAKDDRDRKDALMRAELLAQYGDMSGYEVLGMTPEQISKMEAGYAAQQASSRGSGGGGGGEPRFNPDSIDWSAADEYVRGGGLIDDYINTYFPGNAKQALAAWNVHNQTAGNDGGGFYDLPWFWNEPNATDEVKLNYIASALKSGIIDDNTANAWLDEIERGR